MKATWVVSFRRDDGPTEYSLYDTASHKLTPLFVSQPALSDYKFAHMEDVRIQARDGLELGRVPDRIADVCAGYAQGRRADAFSIMRARRALGQGFLGLQQRRAVVREPRLCLFTGEL